MDMLSVIGFLIIFGGLTGIYFVFKNQQKPTKELSRKSSTVSNTNYGPREVKKELKEAVSGQTVTLIGESERAIQASVSLSEMFQRTPQSSWSRTGLVSKALVLAGDIWIIKVPSKEAGNPIWLKAKQLSAASLGKFYKGTDDLPGPARLFKMNDQSDPVSYKLPKDLTPDVTWEVIDIGTFDAEVDGECDNIANRDRLYFVTSCEQDGDRRLIYLDARKGEAKGSGGLFLAEPFEPSVDVTELM